MEFELLTYRELATKLGTRVDSAQRLAKRNNWPRHKGNDGVIKVQVPIEVVERPKEPAPRDASVLEERIEGLREIVAVMKTATEAHRARADAAEARVADLIQERDRLAALEARSWWQRQFGR